MCTCKKNYFICLFIDPRVRNTNTDLNLFCFYSYVIFTNATVGSIRS